MSESGQKLMRDHLDRVTSSLMSQVMTWVSVGSQEEFSTIQSKFGHITRVSRGRESPGLRASLPHPMIMTFLFLHHNSRKGPHMAGDELFWWENMKWSLFCYNWFSPHYNLVRPCCNVKISIVRPGSQLGGSCRSWLGLNCTLRRLWFRSWHCLQLSLNFTTHHHHMTLDPTVCQKLIFSA